MNPAAERKTIEVVIDERPMAARDGEKVLEVALRNGVEIPHFCHHAHLSTAGSCRMCLVKVENAPKLMPSCNLTVAPNMKVHTQAPEVQAARRNVMQFLMLNHPVDCGVCDKAGECRLQDYEVAFGSSRSPSNEPKHHKRKLYSLSPRLQLDNERCILCTRCVRFTQEISRTHALGVVSRGAHSYVDRLDPQAPDDPYSDNVIALCPTGALLSRDFLYKSRVWCIEPVRSVCTGCARGCNINVWRRKKEWRSRAFPEQNAAIYRITAIDTPAVNGPWLCNKGFDQHKTPARARALTPMINGAPVAPQAAAAQARSLLRAAHRPAFVLSAHASNEELDALKEALASDWGARAATYTRRDSSPEPGEVIEDDLLIKADKNPNTFGVRERFGEQALDASAAARHDLFVIWGDWPQHAQFGDAQVVQLAWLAGDHGRMPDVCIPISTRFERGGSFSNFEGVVSRFEKVFDKPALVQHAAELFAGWAT